MVFMAGPRQTSKTTLARMISGEYANHLYFNWDNPQDRTRLIENPFLFQEIERRDGSSPLVIFDEIHKYTEGSSRSAHQPVQRLPIAVQQ